MIRKNIKIFHNQLYLFCSVLLLIPTQIYASKNQSIILSCNNTNDLYVTLKQNGVDCVQFNTPEEAIDHAEKGCGVMILADGYPERTTVLDESLFDKAKSKNLKMYVEYPSFVPNVEIGKPQTTTLERVVVNTNLITGLLKMQILVMHGCHYLPVSQKDPLLAVGKVAGFDRAIYGLNPDANAILFEQDGGSLLVSTTKLSQFIRARYAPKQAMQSIWAFILNKLESNNISLQKLDWTPEVRSTYSRDEKLPGHAGRLAVQRGIDWHTNAKMLLSEQGWQEYKQLWHLTDVNMHTTVPGVNSSAPQPVSEVGDGRFGVMEGIVSAVHADGSQPTCPVNTPFIDFDGNLKPVAKELEKIFKDNKNPIVR